MYVGTSEIKACCISRYEGRDLSGGVFEAGASRQTKRFAEDEGYDLPLPCLAVKLVPCE